MSHVRLHMVHQVGIVAEAVHMMGASADSTRAELNADARPDRLRGFRDGVLPAPLAGAAHSNKVTVPKGVPNDAPAAFRP